VLQQRGEQFAPVEFSGIFPSLLNLPRTCSKPYLNTGALHLSECMPLRGETAKRNRGGIEHENATE
jgi:hypothetical protein